MSFWLKFLLPGYYYFYSRLPRKSEQISWIIVFPALVLVGILLVSDANALHIIITYIIANFCWLNFYEIGYLENDAITIKLEKDPTLRIPQKEILFVQKNFNKLTLIRIITGAGLLTLIYILPVSKISFLMFTMALAGARLFFFLHNKIRSRFNVLTYHLLSTTKFFAFPLLLLPNHEQLVSLLIALYLSFPLPRTVEHAVKIRYKFVSLKKIVGDLDTFRLKYYFALIAFALVFYFFSDTLLARTVLVISLYYFFYRLVGFLMVRYGAYKRSKFKSHDWTEHKL
ncbi:hypothetical protein POKO110462_19470 [Pontibacter korlensis]|uniref:WbuO protein n=1 Tax=Pontibacter korlensis TaxID=400092 RepID=A0A0E3ZDX4_9BACT|nr:hypothetical protein [Pontibacter korlensis]AKD01948.1 hypothetical protein PKOR_00810 [Pontibacter korlensis]